MPLLICKEYGKWVEEKIETPVKEKLNKTIEKCRKKKCKVWCLCCNKWFCWLETVFYWVVTLVVTIIVKWVVYLLCRVIIFVIIGLLISVTGPLLPFLITLAAIFILWYLHFY